MTWHVEQAQDPPHAPGTEKKRVSASRESKVCEVWEDHSPSISRSCAWAMSSRLSPFETASLCSWPSLSMKVTQSSSPGFGGSTWPCRVDGVEEKDRTGIEGAGRMNRANVPVDGEFASALDIVAGRVALLVNRRGYGEEGVCDEEARMRDKARANVRGVAMAVWEKGRNAGGERGTARRKRLRVKRLVGFWSLDIGRYWYRDGKLQLVIVLPRQQEQPGLQAANARKCVCARCGRCKQCAEVQIVTNSMARLLFNACWLQRDREAQESCPLRVCESNLWWVGTGLTCTPRVAARLLSNANARAPDRQQNSRQGLICSYR